MLRSLRSRLIAASLIWTAGLLMLMHMISIVVIHMFPGSRNADHTAVVLIAFALLAGGVFAARHGLAPFRVLRERLLALRAGKEHRIAGSYPTEVQPLVDDLNALLEDRERAISRALSTAGDLAHGLKTPLALLRQEAASAQTQGHSELAAAIEQQVERMSRHVDYHLARARAASGASGSARCEAAPCIEALIRTVSKLHANRSLHISSQIPAGLHARVQREDLDEILGNLLDNACKWCRGRVAITAAAGGASLQFTIDDDGPGLDPEHRTAALQRGVRLDEAAPGSGLGLAIVRDLVELYGGGIALETSPLGGLRALVTLPRS